MKLPLLATLLLCHHRVGGVSCRLGKGGYHAQGLARAVGWLLQRTARGQGA